MIQQFINAMTTLLLAKFVLNDVLHAARLFDNSFSQPEAWRTDAINQLNSYIVAHGIRPNVLKEIEKQADQIADPEGLKTVLAGYYLLATGVASNSVVDDVANRMITGLKEFARTGADEETIRELGGVEAAYEYVIGFIDARAPGFYESYHNLISATTRSDKVIAIDQIMHYQHESGAVLTEFFGYSAESSVERGLQKLLKSLA